MNKSRNINITLEKAAREWRDVFDAMTDFVWIADPDYRVLRTNRAIADFLKMHPRDMVGRHCYDLLHNSHGPSPECPHRRAIASQKTCSGELYESHLGIYLEITVSPLIDDNGVMIGSVHLARDVTGRKTAQAALKASEEKLKLIFQSTSEGIACSNLDGNISEANDPALRLFGYKSKEEIIGHNFFEFIIPEDHARARKNIAMTIAIGQATGVEYTFLKRDGTRFPGELNASVLNDGSGKPAGFVAVFSDITERKQHEIALASSYRHELETRRKLEEERGRRIKFTHYLVHELKTPLTPMVASSEMLTREAKERRIKRLSRNIYSGTLSLEKRVNELLDLARIEIGEMKLNLQPVDLTKLIPDTVEKMRPMMEDRGQSLSLRLPVSLPQISADPYRLEQVLMNLIGNASKHTPDGSSITVSARREKNRLAIGVQDDGPGISSAAQKHLFDPYFRSEAAQDTKEGLGLGLPITRHIVELHGGRIRVKSKTGQGSTFSFSLPLSTETSLEERGQQE
ncbi:MAG: PAS domain-containing sensor histidine kinase [Dehalococcoidales bacterium]|nr:PAS domain-containing sensor histidine kinase [Dehalococcoidales bacterium]